jgi:hypothetical protein
MTTDAATGLSRELITHCDNDQAVFVFASGQVLMTANTGPGRG